MRISDVWLRATAVPCIIKPVTESATRDKSDGWCEYSASDTVFSRLEKTIVYRSRFKMKSSSKLRSHFPLKAKVVVELVYAQRL